MKFLNILLFALLLTSCKTYNEDQKEKFNKEIEDHLNSNQLDFKKLESGLYYKVLKTGKNDYHIKYTDNVDIYYTGSLLNGEVFQIIKEDEALNFDVKELIVGWQEALSLISEGGEIEIIIPPYLGYGDNKTEKFPEHSILRFVLGVKTVI